MATLLIGGGILEFVQIGSIITGSVKSIYGIIDSLTFADSTDIYQGVHITMFINSLDIRNKLNIYSSLIKEFPGTKSESIRKALISVKDIIIDIEKKLRKIKEKVNYNNKLWFLKGFRAYDVFQDLDQLKLLVNNLEERIKLLERVTNISKLCDSNVFDHDMKNSFLENKYINMDIDISSFEII